MDTALLEPVLLHGHSAQVLDGDGAEWVVEAGKANVFFVRVENGRPVGARRYLLTGQPGDVLLGSTAPELADGYRFLAVGSEDCRLRKLSASELQPGQNGVRLADQVARWVEKLTNLLAADIPSEAPVNTGATEHPVLTAGQVFRSPQRIVCWLKVEEGSLAFMGRSDLLIGPEAPLVPVGSEAWFRADSATRLHLVKAADVKEAAAITRGLAQLHGLIFAYLRHKEQVEIKEDLARLRERRNFEAEETNRAIRKIVSIVTPLEETPVLRSELLQALAVVGRHLKITFAPPAKSEDLSRVPDPLEAVARASKVRLRHVQLRGRWWRTDCGPLLGYLNQGEEEVPVALVRSQLGRYEIFEPRSGFQRPLDAETLSKLSAKAVMFYLPFPPRPLTLLDLPRLAFQLFRRELGFLLTLSLGMTLLGMVLPQATRWIIDYAIPDADRGLLLELGLILFTVTCGQALLMLAQGFVTLRLMTGATATLQAATWDRLLRLAPQFFRKFASGDLLNRSMMITEVSHSLSSSTMRSLVTGCLALVNLLLLFYYSAKLAMVAMLVALVTSAVTVTLSLAIRRRALIMEQLDGRLFGFMVQAINGIAKLRVAGAERRAYSHWATRFAERLRLVATVKRLEDAGSTFNLVIGPLATMMIFTLAASMLVESRDALSMGTFLAFFTAFGIFVGGVTSVSHTLVDIMDSLAKQKLMEPILQAQPEFDDARSDPGRLAGNVFIDKIVFRYQPNSPLILGGVSLVAHTGEFIALVGPSGSGKSTLLRLLLGFERPESGGVYFDGKNLNGLDLTAVRRQFGIVLQSARINSGSIFDNIACGNVIRLEECWQAIRDSGMEEDVKSMPMGIHTFISEGGSNLSGGQRQRLLIARALVLNPKILMFDEATSALDNTTQAIVTQSLKRRHVTRIVIAHRLSTIQDADRIYVLENGQVSQVGRFEELTQEDGLFKRMMARQMA